MNVQHFVLDMLVDQGEMFMQDKRWVLTAAKATYIAYKVNQECCANSCKDSYIVRKCVDAGVTIAGK